MFDPQKAEPVFLEIVKRMSNEAVTVLGETIRRLIDGDFAGANATVVAGRRQISPIEPEQKPLAALHQTVLVHNRLHALGKPIPIDRIWARADSVPVAKPQETTVSHDTQRDLLEEIKQQLAKGGGAPVVCPGCGSRDHVQVGSAALVHHDDGATTQGQGSRALTRYLDPDPLVAILRTDLSNVGTDAATTMRIVAMIAAREKLTVPVARCDGCGLSFVCFALREAAPAVAADPAELAAHGGPGTSFVAAFEQAILPQLIWREADVWAGASVFEFGCGSGSSLAHHATAGMQVSGFEEDDGIATYAREIFGLAKVSGQAEDIAAVSAESITCVTSHGALERTLALGETLDGLCRMVTKNGSIALVAKDGSLGAETDSAAAARFPRLGGRYVSALTPDYLGAQLKARGLDVVRTLRSPARLDDPRFPNDQRDPFTGVPLWSARPGDFLVFAKRR